MDKKIVKKSGVFLVIVSWLLAILSLASLILVILGMVIPNFVQSTWFIVALGELLLPLQMLIDPQMSNGIIHLIILVAVLILSILAIVFVKKSYKFGSHNKRVSFVVSIIISVILFVYATFSLVMLIINFRVIAMAISLLLYALIGENPEVLANLVMIKYIVFCSMVIISSALVLFVFLLNRDKEKRHIDKQFFNVNFYSDEYEEKAVSDNKQDKKEVVEEKTFEVQKTKVKKQSQELINKIMQLNELKDNGQISDVEYTKLRQKAIKRYKA